MALFDWALVDPFPLTHISAFVWSSVLERANAIDNAEIYYSDNGIDWSAGVAPNATDNIQFPLWDTSQSAFFGIIFNRPLLKYYGCKSIDGITWTYTGQITTVTALTWTGLVANNAGRLLAITDEGDCYRSDDGGSSWTNSGADLITIDTDINTLWNAPIWHSAGSVFVVFNFHALGDIPIASSSDGVTWTGRRGFEPTYQQDWIYAVDNSPALAISQANGVVMTSSDGITWTYQTELTTQFPAIFNLEVHGLLYSTQLLTYVVFMWDVLDAITRVVVSEDGITWTEDADLLPPYDDLSAVEQNSWYTPYAAPEIEKFFGLSDFSSLTPLVISPPGIGPDPPEPDILLELIGGEDGGSGIEFSGSGSLFVGWSYTGSGGIEMGGDQTQMILSVDSSGIYTFIANQRFDRVYTRNTDPDDTTDVKIPDPFIKTAYLGS